MSGRRGMIQSSGKVSTLLSRRFWQTNLLPQLVKSFFLSYELLKRSFFPLQTPMCATRSISISLTSDHRVDPSLILIQIIVTSRTAHQFILQNLCYIMCSNTRTCYPLKLVITTWNKKNIRIYWITLAYFTHGKWMHERTIEVYDVSWKMTCDEQARNTVKCWLPMQTTLWLVLPS